MHVVGAVAHAGGGDDVVGVELAVLVAAAVRGERAAGRAPAVAWAVRVRLDGPDVDEVGSLGAVAHPALTAVRAAASVLAFLLTAVLALVRAVPGVLAAVAALAVTTTGTVAAPVVAAALVVGAEPAAA